MEKSVLGPLRGKKSTLGSTSMWCLQILPSTKWNQSLGERMGEMFNPSGSIVYTWRFNRDRIAP